MTNKTRTILCIDDEQDALKLRKLLLESAGYHALTARSGSEGIRVFQSERVDAVVLDYWMADMNGVAVALELRRLNPKIPIMMFSAFVPLPGEEVGTSDLWILKGEEPEYLLAKLKQLLETHEPR